MQIDVKYNTQAALNAEKILIRSNTLEKGLREKRNTIARYLSDIISEEIGLGNSLQESDKKLFDKGSTAADAVIDIEEFAKVTGVNVPRSDLPGAEANVAFFETKVAGLGSDSAIQFTSTTVSSLANKDLFGQIQSNLTVNKETGIKNKEIRGDEAVELLFTPAFAGIRETLFTSTKQKMENLLLINFTTEAGRQPVIKYQFLKTPIPQNEGDIFSSAEKFSRYFTIRIRPTSYKGEAKAYRVLIGTTTQLKNEIKKNTIDITESVKKLQRYSVDFLLDELYKRINASTSKKVIAGKLEYLSLAHAIANDFKRSGHTPFIIRTVISSREFSAVSGTLRVTGKAKSTNTINKPKPQKFMTEAQWTALVQAKLGQSMLSFGEPEPPDIKERSGRFRRSVEVRPNYKTGTLSYEYHPDYRSLEHYGYHPELQVERSIRQVAQEYYTRAFSIVRRGSLA